jgi:hypothetical protein
MLGAGQVKYGYARVSTDDQTPPLQLAALKKVGCKTIFKDDGLSRATTKGPALLRLSAVWPDVFAFRRSSNKTRRACPRFE